MRRIVLSYSKNHFNPEGLETQSGAGFLAQSIYSMLNSKYTNSKVEYYDHTEHGLIVKGDFHSDLFIGISNNIEVFNKKLRPKQSILFAVNYSALSRRRIKKRAKDLFFSQSLLNWEDGIHSNLKELDGVSAVVTLGNFSNYHSYVESGMKPSRVFPISCSFGYEYQSNHQIRKNFGNDILYFPGGISFRKGVAYIRPIVDWISRERAGRKLRVIGRAANQILNAYIADIVAQFPENIVWEQRWIERDSNVWNENISKSRFAIFPSFEEGVPASVVDLIKSGIPVLYSSACGLDFVSKDVVPRSMDVTDWVELLSSVVARNDVYLSNLLTSQKFMLESLPNDLYQLEGVLEKFHLESIWPSTEVSESLKKQIPGDSWLLKSSGEAEYRIYELDSLVPIYPLNVIDSSKEMQTEDLIAIAITQLDKYSKFERLTIQNFSRIIVIERVIRNLHSSVFYDSKTTSKLELITMVHEYKGLRLPNAEKSFLLLKNRIFQSITYRFRKLMRKL